ncbi:MAG: hypothetical protein OCD76_17980 [Reichenbachiella sp.]
MRTITVLLLSIISFQGYSQKDTAELIPWTPEYHLKWEDFRGSKIDSIYGMAVSCISIAANSIQYGDSISYQITNTFKPQLSFVDSIVFELYEGSPELLEHEQTHFNIAEIHTRLMRRKLKELASTNTLTDESYSKEIDLLYDMRDEMDSLYDKETAHGILPTEQLRWQNKVKQQLIELEDYYSSNVKE